MKYLPLFFGLLLSGCGLIENVQKSTQAIENNQRAISSATEWIQYNTSAVAQSSATIQQNGQEIAQATQSIRENREVVQQSNDTIHQNRQAVMNASHAIEQNRDIVSSSTETIHANRDAIDLSTKAIMENAEVVRKSTEMLSKIHIDEDDLMKGAWVVGSVLLLLFLLPILSNWVFIQQFKRQMKPLIKELKKKDNGK